MTEEKIISIITINYNGLKDTCELMETLPLDDTSIEVIVVDNASQQDEASVIEQRYPQVKVIRSSENLGFAGGNKTRHLSSSNAILRSRSFAAARIWALPVVTTSVLRHPVVSISTSSTTIHF